jgi:predicted porin
MKKTMIALAAFGALTGAAHAQSSVTLYGLVDMYVGQSKVEATNLAGTTSTKITGLRSGGLSGSRWGVRGAEDLGGGLKATFQLESGISADTGVSAGFNRTSKVGLAGGFGSIEMGRQYTRVFNLIDSYDAQGTSRFSATNAYFVNMGDAVRWDNSLVYSTPDMGGFSASAQYAFGENPALGVSAGRSMGILLGYAAGPVSVHGAYQSTKFDGATPTNKVTALGASYDFRVVKLLGQYIQQKDGSAADVKENFYNLSLAIPVGSAGAFNIGTGQERQKTAGVKTSKTSAYGVEYRHSLSKRTTVYAALSHLKTETATTIDKDQLYGVGLRHSF